jgi:hypothetical protein
MKVKCTLIRVCLLWAVLLSALPAVVQAQFTFTTNNGALTITGCSETNSDITIPSSTNSLLITGITGFSSNPYVINLTIAASVTNLGYTAFYKCINLKALYFMGNCPVFGSFTFLGAGFLGAGTTGYYLPGTIGWSSYGGNYPYGIPITLWNPTIETTDGSFGVQTNGFGFNINWASGQTVVVEACTNLTNPVWTPVATNTLTGGTSYFSDPQWTNYPSRFYRLISP